MTQIDPFTDWVEAYINSLHWSFGTSDYEKTLVAGNIRGFASWVNANLLKPALESRTLWVVGKDSDEAWEIIGVFSTEEKACFVCQEHDDYFVGTMMEDEALAYDLEWWDTFYPSEGKLT
jgi:hypothetical protein